MLQLGFAGDLPTDLSRTNEERMKLSISFGLMILSCATIVRAQSPSYSLLLPVYTDAGEYTGDYDIGRAILSADGRVIDGALAPEMLATLAIKEYAPHAVPDGEGGLYVAYTIEHVDSANKGDTDLLLRRIDADGNDLWIDSLEKNVRFIAESAHLERTPHLIRTDDGVMVLYEIEYRTGQYAGDVDIAATRFNSDGEPVWEEPVWIANSEMRERFAGSFPSDGKAGVLFVREGPNGGTEVSDIYTTLLREDGSVGWSPEMRDLAIAASGHLERNPASVTDGNGGAYIAYEIEYVGSRKNGDVDVIAQHVSVDGVRRWTDTENPPFVATSSGAKEWRPVLTADSSGVTVAFEMTSSSVTSDSGAITFVGAQRLDLLGRPLWNDGLRSTVIPVLNRTAARPIVRGDGVGGCYIIFDGRDTITGDVDVFAQRVTPEGALTWNRNHAIPVFFGPMPESLIDAIVDPRGGLVVIAAESDDYRVKNGGPRDTTFIAHRLDANGLHSWGIGEHNLLVTRAKMGDHAPVVISSP